MSCCSCLRDAAREQGSPTYQAGSGMLQPRGLPKHSPAATPGPLGFLVLPEMRAAGRSLASESWTATAASLSPRDLSDRLSLLRRDAGWQLSVPGGRATGVGAGGWSVSSVHLGCMSFKWSKDAADSFSTPCSAAARLPTCWEMSSGHVSAVRFT